MEKKTLYKIEDTRDRLRLIARITAFAPLAIGIIIIWVYPPTLLAIIIGLMLAALAWFVPWLGGITMMLLTGPGFFALHGSHWEIGQALPYYILDITFFISGVLHIIVSVLGWVLRDEWPLER